MDDNVYIDLKIIIEELKGARKEKGLSQAQVASLSGLSQSTVSNFENGGDKSCNFATVVAYASAVGRTIYIGRQ